MKTVSIITVCYNAASTIMDTLESVSTQIGVEIEHIVVDGDSKDGTQALVAAYQGSEVTLYSEPDDGLYDAMNKGVARAKGDIVAFLNADDVYAHERVVADAVQAISEAAVRCAYANLVFVDPEHTNIIKRVWTSRQHVPGLCLTGWMPAHPTLFMHRQDFLDLGGFDTALKYQADLEFCARAFDVKLLSSIYVADTWVRMRLGGISTGAWRNRIKGNWESYVALRKLGLRRDPISFFCIKFGRKLPELFKRKVSLR